MKTAGLTHFSRKVLPSGILKFDARIELSTKVLDNPQRLRMTLAHEMCHVAAWLLSHTAKPPHGRVFYGWAQNFTDAYPGMTITTCHNYDIAYAFQWQCSNEGCGRTYGRHSNSLDITKKVCGICHGRLISLGRRNADGTPAKQRPPNAYSLFVKAHYASVVKAAPARTPQRVVMQALAKKWVAHKQAEASTDIDVAARVLADLTVN